MSSAHVSREFLQLCAVPMWFLDRVESPLLVFDIQGKPHAQARARRTREAGTRMVKPDRVEEQAIGWQMRAQYRGAPLRCRIAIFAAYFVPDRRKIDGSNMQKAIEDAGNRLVWWDDSQIDLWHGERMIDADCPRVVLAVGQLKGEQP